MEGVETKTVEYVAKELERLKKELQHLETMLLPEENDGLSEEELKELLREARDDSIEWKRLEDLPEPRE